MSNEWWKKKDICLTILRFLDVGSLCAVAVTCKALLAASRVDALWPKEKEFAFRSYVWLASDDSTDSTGGYLRCKRLVSRFKDGGPPRLVPVVSDDVLTNTKSFHAAAVGMGRSEALWRLCFPDKPIMHDYAPRADSNVRFNVCGSLLTVDDVIGYHNGAEPMRRLHYIPSDCVFLFFKSTEAWSIQQTQVTHTLSRLSVFLTLLLLPSDGAYSGSS